MYICICTHAYTAPSAPQVNPIPPTTLCRRSDSLFSPNVDNLGEQFLDHLVTKIDRVRGSGGSGSPEIGCCFSGEPEHESNTVLFSSFSV